MNREPKTIEEARALIVSALPARWECYISAHFHDHPGRSSAGYRASINRENADHRDCVCVEAGNPAQLAKQTIKALFAYIERHCPDLLPAPRSQSARTKGRGQLKLTYKRA